MQLIAGKGFKEATQDDFQRLYFCAPPGGKQCGSPPCSCSNPPCNKCFDSTTNGVVKKDGCEEGDDSIKCKAPPTALAYNGMEWPTMTFPGKAEMHIFAIGDWGGMDGTLAPVEGRARMVAYRGGNKAGPSVFPRTRFNKHHSVELCSHTQFTQCYNSKGMGCTPGCGYVPGVDDKAQLLVAQAMQQRAARNSPQYILNVGDNFYWGGIEKTCGTPMDQISYTAHHQFDQIYESVYTGPGLDQAPWFSVLGNHDWGGRVFNNGWDQQIAYTWNSKRWVMPAAYYSARVEYPDQAMDASDMNQDPEHNICGAAHNPKDASCASQGGPESIATCKKWFWDMWAKQQAWVQDKLTASTADWQIIVTHFPCGHQSAFYQKMHQQFGLDLLITGHRHDQELWDPKRMGGLTCFVTGGGGGISSEATPNPMNKRDWYGEAQYGFYDMTINKERILIQSINWDGTELQSATVDPIGLPTTTTTTTTTEEVELAPVPVADPVPVA
ncbi:unnamed protein product [Polarella glacialis]|uniref:Calcineurin-like phosphoesterase domain-containing protein n=2 Tax=Polarella glacialis TaxID=89957 RepID=A0A813EDU2_POLGL|nr:unnamed protein product [Polarella glacialis]